MNAQEITAWYNKTPESNRGWKWLKDDCGVPVSGIDPNVGATRTYWTVGEWKVVAPPTTKCNGYNASPTPKQAAWYVNRAKRTILALVECDGYSKSGADKSTHEAMRIVATWRVEPRSYEEVDVDTVLLSEPNESCSLDSLISNTWEPLHTPCNFQYADEVVCKKYPDHSMKFLGQDDSAPAWGIVRAIGSGYLPWGEKNVVDRVRVANLSFAMTDEQKALKALIKSTANNLMSKVFVDEYPESSLVIDFETILETFADGVSSIIEGAIQDDLL